MKKNIICVVCPKGCNITVETEENNEHKILSIEGNSCPKGYTYAKKELSCPTRVVTSTVRVTGSSKSLISVKTKQDIPKQKIMECMQALKDIQVQAPISIGDIILPNVADTGIDIVATQDAE